jgi:hypothetical protein
MKGKPTYNDFREAKPIELMKIYRLTPRELENAQRKHLYGASQSDMKNEYEQFYIKSRKDA